MQRGIRLDKHPKLFLLLMPSFRDKAISPVNNKGEMSKGPSGLLNQRGDGRDSLILGFVRLLIVFSALRYVQQIIFNSVH